PWGRHEGPFSLCPTDPGSVMLIESLYDELLPHFSSRLFNVGCDETFELGQGRSKGECEKRGKERVYLDFLLKIHKLVKERGRRMQFWGDIILHRPELIPELPSGLIALEWGYEANHPFDKEGEMFRNAGVPFYVCPGTSSWLSITGRTENAVANLKNAAENGLKHGAIGYLITDWGDLGHLQYLPVSYLGFAAGAAYSWNWAGNRGLAMTQAISAHVFRDRAGVMGRLAYELGNVYGKLKRQITNSTLLFWQLVGGPMRAERKKELEQITREEYDAVESAIDAAIAPVDRARMGRADAALIAEEFRNAAAMLKHACRRGRMSQKSKTEDHAAMKAELSSIIGEHRRLWLARNRVGGLADSTRRLEARLAEG
ncbi:MAG TPA: family 20 glycosylhydrolase, partial [Tepidisphaeraceae bacterium]|nr:family 20 glycosylhydrolase [Tepidisphaeraceae bacterium]